MNFRASLYGLALLLTTATIQRISTQSVGSGANPAVASDGTSFLVAWDDAGDPPLVYARLLGANGAPTGDPFRVDPFDQST